MLLTITLNSSLDKAVRLPKLTKGAINRADQTEAAAGGKGNNTARVARQLGLRVRATGFLGGYTGQCIGEQLRGLGVEDSFILTEGTTRTCLALLDEASGVVTEVLEPGPAISPDEWHEFMRRLPDLANGCAYAVIAGSLPPGVPQNAYGLITDTLTAAGTKVLLDASGSALEYALEARPWMIKINESEAVNWAGARLLVAVSKLLGYADVVIITRGVAGASLYSSVGTWQAASPPVQARSAVGSGDAFAAGVMWSLLREQDVQAALGAGVAAGAANAMTLKTGYLDPEVFERLRRQVKVTEFAERML